jgi:hypothetical protein
LSDRHITGAFLKKDKLIQQSQKIQLVKNLQKKFSTQQSVLVEPCLEFLENLKI